MFENLKKITLGGTRKKYSFVFLVFLVLLALLIVFFVLEAMPSKFQPYEGNIICSMDELNWNIENEQNSRTSFITPVTSSCKIRRINKETANSVFQYSNYSDFLSSDFKHYAVYDGDNLHSLRFTWRIDDSVVVMVVDPTNSPSFLLVDGIEQHVNGYQVAAKKTNYDGNTYEIDIGLEKEGIGVWIFGNSKNEAKIEELLNLVLNSNIELSNL